MNKFTIISFFSLLLIVIILPLYAWQEPARMEAAQAALRQTFVSDAAVMYVENCAVCHGAAGEGVGAMPALDNEGLRTADYDFLYKTIARGRYDTAMTGWHVEEGGVFNDYQVDELVALIRYGDWSQVGELAAAQGLIPPSLPVPEVDDALLAEVANLSPDGNEWAAGMSLYANNCTICHGVNGEGTDLAVPLNTPELRGMDTVELIRIIQEGVPGTMMAGWDNALSPADIEALASFLQNWDQIQAEGIALPSPEPVRIDLNNPEEVAALGERLFDTTCAACHGEEGSGGTGPALNSLQFLTNNSDEQIANTIINGGHRPGSVMPAFGDRFTTTEIEALVSYIRAWEPTATWVENPRGTAQGGGPPWLRATPDPDNPVAPQETGKGRGRGGPGGPARQQDNNQTAVPDSSETPGPTLHYLGEVTAVNGNLLSFSSSGVPLEAMLGPPWYWEEFGIPLAVGDQIELEGFASTDHMEVNWLTNLTTGQTIQLRSPEGVPVWSGGQ